MTDPFNTMPLEDTQSLQALNFGRDFNEEESQTHSQMYEEGLSALERRGVYPVPDIAGPYAYHSVYVRCRPLAIPGINYREDFRVRLAIHSPNHQLLIEDIINSLSESVRKFWLPLIEADPAKRKPLYQHSLRLLAAESAYRQYHSTDPYDMGISLNEHSGCRAWIPKLDSFAPQLLEVTWGDVFTILPRAENELFRLIMGRAVVGRDNSKLTEGEIINHTSRMSALIVGRDAGLGKTTLFDAVIATLRKVGYRVQTYGKMDSRFNLGEIAASHLTYKDDMTKDTLRAFLKSENTKIMITGGSLRTEEKGVNAVNTPCHTVIIGNTNEYDPRIIYEIDTGIADRIKPMEAIREAMLNSQDRSALIADSPTLKPYQHLPWLAQKLNVSIDALILYAMRLAANDFYAIASQGKPGAAILEKTVRDLTSQCKIQFRLDSTDQLLGAAYFCQLLRFGRFEYSNANNNQLPCFDSIQFGQWMGHLELVMSANELEPVRQIIRTHFLELGKPKGHPQAAFNILSPRSLLVAYQNTRKIREINNHTSELQSNLADALKASLGAVRLMDGFSVSSDPVWCARSWENIAMLRPLLIQWVKEIRSRVTQAYDNSPENWQTVVDILHGQSYNSSIDLVLNRRNHAEGSDYANV